MKPKLIFLAILIGVFAYLQYRLWFETGGLKDIWQLKKEITQQDQENLVLKKRNDELIFQIERMQNSADAMESRARNELGMVKKDEVFYQVVKKDR